MRILLVGIFLLAATQAVAGEATSIEGVRIYGHVQAVSKKDIQVAIAEFERDMSQAPVSFDIVSHDEIHAYMKLHDLGWLTVKRTTIVEADGSEHPGWVTYGQGIRDFPRALQCIRSARKVYVFPIATPLKPHRDNKNLRLVTGYARSILIDMLGYKSDWFSGINNLITIGGEPRNIGLIFRNGNDELVLFFSSAGRVQGTFNGENVSGSLEMESPVDKMRYWKQHYAQPELGSHKGP